MINKCCQKNWFFMYKITACWTIAYININFRWINQLIVKFKTLIISVKYSKIAFWYLSKEQFLKHYTKCTGRCTDIWQYIVNRICDIGSALWIVHMHCQQYVWHQECIVNSTCDIGSALTTVCVTLAVYWHMWHTEI